MGSITILQYAFKFIYRELFHNGFSDPIEQNKVYMISFAFFVFFQGFENPFPFRPDGDGKPDSL
jgi:hypothetical protein